MSTRSRPTSSSSPTQSPRPDPPYCLSSSFSSSSSSCTSSSDKAISVGTIQAIAPQVEEIRGDDASNVSDRSNSSERPRPHEGPAWVNPKVCGITSEFHTDASLAEFLDKFPVLKASAESPFCRSVVVLWTTRCTGDGHLPNPPFSSCIVVYFQTCTCRFLSTRSRWASFRRSTWCRVTCTRTRGRPCKLFVWYVGCSKCVPYHHAFFTSTPLIHLSWSVGIPWSAGQVASCSRLSRPLIRTLKRSSLRCSWSWLARLTFLTRPVVQGFLCFRRGIPLK